MSSMAMDGRIRALETVAQALKELHEVQRAESDRLQLEVTRLEARVADLEQLVIKPARRVPAAVQ